MVNKTQTETLSCSYMESGGSRKQPFLKVGIEK